MAGNHKKRDQKIHNFVIRAKNPEFWSRLWEDVLALDKYDRRYHEVLDKHQIPYAYYREYLDKFPAIKQQELEVLKKLQAKDLALTSSRISQKQTANLEDRLDQGEIVDYREIRTAIQSANENAKMLDRETFGEKAAVQITNITTDFITAHKLRKEAKVINPTKEIQDGNSDTDPPRRSPGHDDRDDFRIDQQ